MKNILSLLFIINLLIVSVNGQEFIWGNIINGINSIESNDLIIDPLNNYYVTGSFNGTIYIDGDRFESKGEKDAFIAKFTPTGDLIWFKREGGDNTSLGRHLSSDKNGNIILIGEFEGKITLGETDYIESSSIYSSFITKYDTSGNIKHVKIIPAKFNSIFDTKSAVISAALCDNNSNLLLTGSFGKLLENDENFSEDAKIILLDHYGYLVWSINTNGRVLFQDIEQDNLGNFYLTGYIGSSSFMTSGQSVTIGDSTVKIKDGADILLVKLNNSGKVVWIKTLSKGIYDRGKALTITKAGDLYLTGTITTKNGSENEYRYFITKYDNNGNQIWLKYTSGGELNEGVDITSDSIGNIYSIGKFRGKTYFDDISLNSGNLFQNSFIIKHNDLGEVLWVQKFLGDSGSSTIASAIVTDNKHNLILTGKFYNNISFGKSKFYCPVSSNIFQAALKDTLIKNGSNLITGNVFNDVDENCKFNDADTMLSTFTIIAEPGPIYSTTDKNGYFTLNLDSGKYKISLLQPRSHLFESRISCYTDKSYIINLTGNSDTIRNLNFATEIKPNILYKIQVDPKEEFVNCSGKNKLIVNIKNLGLIDIDSINLIIQFPSENFDFTAIDPDSFEYKSVNDTLYISVLKLKTNQEISISILYSIICNGNFDPYLPFFWEISASPKNQGFADATYYNQDIAKIYLEVPRANEINEKEVFRISPNPSRGYLNISPISDTFRILNIFDSNGKKVASMKANNIPNFKHINISYLKQGFYIFELINTNTVYRKPVLILK